MNKTIYYFTATGNSLHAALYIAEGLGDAEGLPPAEVVSVTKAGMNVKCNSDVIGFVFPSFCWGMPNMMRDFIASGDFNKDAYFFTVVTCGASPGGSAFDADALLREKGAKLSYSAKVKMVSNYIPMYEINTAAQDEVLAKAERELDIITGDLKERKSNAFKKARLISKIHKMMMKDCKTEDKKYNVSDACDGCGICAAVCPAGNIELPDGKPGFKHNCEHCIACIHWCPRRAINYKDKTQKRKRYHHPKVKAEQLP